MFTRKDRRPRPARHRTSRPSRRNWAQVLEQLEDRQLLTTFHVTTPADNGNNAAPVDGSLRQAIVLANRPGSNIDVIDCTFDTSQPIVLQSALPAITASGLTLKGNGVFVNGSLTGSQADGFVLKGKKVDLEDFGVVNFSGAGIRILGNADSVGLCAVGTWFADPYQPGPNLGNGVGIVIERVDTATISACTVGDNATNGIEVRGSSSVTIEGGFIKDNFQDGVYVQDDGSHGNGYNTSLLGNTIIRNRQDGVHLVNASSNLVGNGTDLYQNFIGCDHQKGTPGLGNFRDGIRIESTADRASKNNVISFNAIADNHGSGVTLMGPNTFENTLTKNNIGLAVLYDLDQTMEVYPDGNWHDGVAILEAAHDNHVGARAEGNTIADNGDSGVHISGQGSTGNTVASNSIGFCYPFASTNPVATPNFYGVLIAGGASGNQIGGAGRHDLGLGNIISGNTDAGIRLTGNGVTGNLVQGNFVGTTPDGLSALPNLNGVSVDLSAAGNQIGGLGDPTAFKSSKNVVSYTGEGNLIAGNTRTGLLFVGTSDNTVESNFIGMDVTGEKALPNGDGVQLGNNAVNNELGTARAGNLISGNGGEGVLITGEFTTGNTLVHNTIGLTLSGKGNHGNTLNGVHIQNGATHNYVGNGNGPFFVGNVISANLQNGVELSGPGTSHNLVAGNYIGTDPTASKGLANLVGVKIDQGASSNFVGGFDPQGKTNLGNVLSGNASNGVTIVDAGTSGNQVLGNRIGTDVGGTKAVLNAFAGVRIGGGATGNFIGSASDRTMSASSPANLISGNGYDGVVVDLGGTSQNHIEGNLIGTKASGLEALPNGRYGVYFTKGASGNFLGGGTDAAGNLVSGNTAAGVFVDIETNANFIVHNQIGVKRGGASGLANTADGVDLLGDQNGVGWNLISGNSGHGVAIYGSKNGLFGNRIGTDVNGAYSVANLQDGVYLNVQRGPGSNVVGAAVADAGNLISGNGWNGIEATGVQSSGQFSADNRIQNNRIGTDAAGKSAVLNVRNGIFINRTHGYAIGGSEALAGNLVSGNGQDGILLSGRETTGIVVQGNRVGTNADGTSKIANTGNGVHVDNSSDDNLIGGTDSNQGNLISGNNLDGLLLSSLTFKGNRVLGNRIGTDASGQFAVANTLNGVEIVGSNGNTIGGDTAAAGNLISGNKRVGILIGAAKETTVAGNLVGTDRTGTKPVPNQVGGIALLAGAANNLIGGVPTTSSAPGNVVSGNVRVGVLLSDAGTKNNVVQGNLIGTDRSGNAPLGNTGDGVAITFSASNNTIGGSGGVGLGRPGNVITANGGDGVRLFGGGVSYNLVQGNRIGAYAGDQTAAGNVGHGVYLAAGAQSNTIGGSDAAHGNVIVRNGKAGVAVGAVNMDNSTVHNPIQSNSIAGNQGLGIDLGDDAWTPNSPGGPHPGPNQLQNYPVVRKITVNANSTTIEINLASTANATFLVQVFASNTVDPSGFGEGETFLGSVLIQTNFFGNGTGQLVVPSILTGKYISATATSATGDTSEFGKSVQAKVLISAAQPGVGLGTARNAGSFASKPGTTGNAAPVDHSRQHHPNGRIFQGFRRTTLGSSTDVKKPLFPRRAQS